MRAACSPSVLAKALFMAGCTLMSVSVAFAEDADSSREPTYQDQKFDGVIRAVSFACRIDAVCFMDVSGTTVIFGGGMLSGPWGAAELGNNDEIVGKTVSVYCGKYRGDIGWPDPWCSLEGKTDYYIKLHK